MKSCDKCKERQATVHMTDIRNQEIQDETHLCNQCAEMEGLEVGMDVDLAELVPDDVDPEEVEEMERRREELRSAECPECGMTFEDFRGHQLLGCPRDYEVFSDGLDPLIKQVHDRIEHHGKVPGGVSEIVRLDQEIQKKERELQDYIDREAFEEAARVRDEIEELKKKKEDVLEEKKEKEEPPSDEADADADADNTESNQEE